MPGGGSHIGVQGREPLAGSGAEPQWGAGRSPAKKKMVQNPRLVCESVVRAAAQLGGRRVAAAYGDAIWL